jgi:tetratricopeptide (TPR) repeat protein
MRAPLQRKRRRCGVVLLAQLLLACGTPPPAAPPDAQGEPPARGVAPLIARAEGAAQAGNHDLAIEAYGQALERTPWNTRLQRRLALEHGARAEQRRAAGGPEALRGAEADLRRALELEPSDPTLARNLGIVVLERARAEPDPATAAALRAEGERLAPGPAADLGDTRLAVERRIDLAYELVQRGQLEMGVRQLEALHRELPGREDLTRLLAQAQVRQGNLQLDGGDPARASESFERAVALYRELAPCDGRRCSAEELRVAHHNRIAALIEDERGAEAQRALAEARALGLELPELPLRR